MTRARVRVLVLGDVLGDPSPSTARLARWVGPLPAVRVVPGAALGTPGALRRAVAAAPHVRLVLGLRRAVRPRGRKRLARLLPAGTRVLTRRGGRWSASRASGAGLIKLSEADLTAVLAVTPTLGEELRTLPAATWAARCVVRASHPERSAALPGCISAGAVTLRGFDDVTCRPGQIAYAGRLLLPGTFRKAGHRPLHTSTLVDLDGSVAQRPAPEPPPTPLAGAHLYLDNVARPHFGHALTEQVSQLWGWPLLRDRHPGLRLLLGHRGPGRPALTGWERELYAAAGIPVERIRVVAGPVAVERLYTASPMYRLPDEVHPDVADLWRRLGDALAAAASRRPWPRRVFLTRRGGNRPCRNVDQLEAVFVDRGFTVVAPETLAVADQVALVRHAEVVAGLAGSGMFGTALAGRPRHVIVVGSASYTAQNEYLMAALLGHRLDLAWCRPEVARGERFDRRSFHSGFTYDFAGPEHAFVSRVLAEL